MSSVFLRNLNIFSFLPFSVQYTQKRMLMLYTLFSPSEGKNSGGQPSTHEPLSGLNPRQDILTAYQHIIDYADETDLSTLFGIKKVADFTPYLKGVNTTEFMPAIERYSGVAYDYLRYTELSEEAQNYLKKQTIIFSNLYGPLLGGDEIINYKVKQGNSIGDIVPEKYYKERFSYHLDLLLSSHDILDLRAGYYDKFYKISRPYTTLKFLKNGKVVSHWAKAYRGIVLRQVALHNIQSIDAFMKLEIEGLMINEIKKIKNKTEIIFDIV